MHSRVSIVPYLAAATLSGCALNPISVSEQLPDGSVENYYLSNALCGAIADASLKLGVFASEKGTSLSGGHFSVWIYNLSELPMTIDSGAVSYYDFTLQNTERLNLSPRGKQLFGERRFTFDNLGDVLAVHISIELGGGAFTADMTLERERTNSYAAAIGACGAPASASELLQRANKSLERGRDG